jgi:hypothetical protein
LGCPNEAALLVAQTTSHLVVYDLEELNLVGALGFDSEHPPLAKCDALGPAFRKPLGAFLSGLPVYFPSETGKMVNLEEEEEEDSGVNTPAVFDDSQSADNQAPILVDEDEVNEAAVAVTVVNDTSDNVGANETSVSVVKKAPPPLITNALEIVKPKRWFVCCSGSGVTVVCSTEPLRMFGMELPQDDESVGSATSGVCVCV